MTSLFLSKSVRISVGTSAPFHRCYHAGRAGSLNTAIARGLRKSKGMGFRGKATLDPGDPREKYRAREGISAYTPPEPGPDSRFKSSRVGRGKSFTSSTRDGRRSRGPVRLERASISDEPERLGRYGEVVRGGTLRKIEYKERRNTDDRRFKSRDRPEPVSQRQWERLGKEEAFRTRDNNPSRDYNPDARNQAPSALPSFSKRSGDRPPGAERFNPRSRDTFSKSDERRGGSSTSARPRDGFSADRDSFRGTTFQRSKYLQEENRFDSSDQHRPKETDSNEAAKSRFTQQLDKRIPISIPYTTPASEFLYGTHLVEAALSSRREPRRKLYKLYIFAEAGREDPARDSAIIRLAQKNKVEIVRVDKAGLPMMDKMSGGRPHNGYILEGSPLPKMPVQSLGAVGPYGFGVTVDHQSREEAAVNGTENFISVPVKSTRKNPLVLLLDSIVDPGNLGGILRTAAFLGVSAVAISTRNSASFTPVVLKASAGASENITLFEVKKPAGFLVDSQANGWKVFAAVAPSRDQNSTRVSMSTDDLDDPLSEAPCVLMLGSEGEGLRWNLRSKADVDLYIEGCGSRHNVDSLNVSVAAGILCSSFLNGKDYAKPPTQSSEVPEPESSEPESVELESGRSDTIDSVSVEPEAEVPNERLF